ncbi:hypothetical protein RS030_111860 [Cryptosporidium xiaoi]|uniref:Uncharacterized protein n=1 Tax=Cryptosporidium xiaoi TaxID=659607 RepID=A0AAV9Y2E3_9CRYT
MEILNETNLSVVTTSASNSEHGTCSNSNETKTQKLGSNCIVSCFDSNKENISGDINELNTECINNIQYNSEYNVEVANKISESENINLNADSCSDFDDDSDIEIIENDVREQLAMMVPDLDSTLKLKHDTERFYMTLSIAEAELVLAKSTSKVNNFNQEEIQNKNVDTNCLSEIRGYVEELLDTINETRNTSFNMQKIIEECYDILKNNISFNDITTLNTMDIGGINNINYVNAEKLKVLCEIIADENNSLKSKIKNLTKEKNFESGENINYLSECKSDTCINSEFYNNDYLKDSINNIDVCLSDDNCDNTYYNRDNKSGWRYILMRFFAFACLLIVLNPAEIHSDMKSINTDLSNVVIPNDSIKFENISKLEEKSEQELISDFHNKLKKIQELGYYDKENGFSLCSIISEFDIFNNCFTKIRLS